MKTAIISDVHSNQEALLAVLARLEAEDPGEVWFLGDAVGYGPEPEECLAILRERCSLLLMGNHDAGAVGLTDTALFNVYARRAVEFSAAVLAPESRQYLASLPLRLERGGAELVHASPFEPSAWHYVFTLRDARAAFESFSGQVCFIGHSHHPLVLAMDGAGEITAELFAELTLRAGSRYIVNVGSVGQPRDGDPRACCALWDQGSGTARLVRVPYDVGAVQAKMSARGLPGYLIGRLARGV